MRPLVIADGDLLASLTSEGAECAGDFMWCNTCQQDVPAVAADGPKGVCCVRCHGALSGGSDSRGAVSESEGAETRIGSVFAVGVDWRPPGDMHDWELSQKLRHVKHVLRRISPDTTRAGGDRAAHRIDAAHQGIGRWHAKPTAPSAVPAEPVRTAPEPVKPRTSSVAWNLTLLGLATFSCGVSLLIGSELSGRADLWSLGMPITLAGQAGLVLGMIFAMANIGRRHRELSKQLDTARHESGDRAQPAPTPSLPRGALQPH